MIVADEVRKIISEHLSTKDGELHYGIELKEDKRDEYRKV